MIEVMQTDVSQRTGNCVQACIGSILNKQMDELPEFRRVSPESPMRAVIEWAKTRGVGVIEVKPGGLRSASEGLYCVVAVRSNLYHGKFHAVVGQINHRGIVILRHDPVKSKKKSIRRKKGTRIDDWFRLYFIVQLAQNDPTLD